MTSITLFTALYILDDAVDDSATVVCQCSHGVLLLLLVPFLICNDVLVLLLMFVDAYATIHVGITQFTQTFFILSLHVFFTALLRSLLFPMTSQM